MIEDFSFITNTLHQILTINSTSLLFIIIINIVIKKIVILLGIRLYSY